MAKRPTSTFAAQRASAVVLIPLALWFLWSLAAHAGADFTVTQNWLGQWWNKALFGLFVTAGVFHGRIGLHEIIADYLHGPLNRALNAMAMAAAIAISALTWISLFQI